MDRDEREGGGNFEAGDNHTIDPFHFGHLELGPGLGHERSVCPQRLSVGQGDDVSSIVPCPSFLPASLPLPLLLTVIELDEVELFEVRCPSLDIVGANGIDEDALEGGPEFVVQDLVAPDVADGRKGASVRVQLFTDEVRDRRPELAWQTKIGAVHRSECFGRV